MEPAPDDFEDLLAQTTADKFLSNALLIALVEKGALTRGATWQCGD